MRIVRWRGGCLALGLVAMGGCSEPGLEASTAAPPGQVRSALGVGTPELVQDIQPLPDPYQQYLPSSEPWQIQWVGDTLFFLARDAVHGRELWVGDGSSAGTRLVLDINPGAADSNPRLLTQGTGVLYFFADSPSGSNTLWVSDGTAGGTRPFLPASVSSSLGVDALAHVEGTLFLAARHFEVGQGLWKSDGTPEGTVLVKDVYPTELLQAVGGTLFFLADGGTGPALWKSDGTPEGTVPLKDFPQFYPPHIRDSERVGGRLFFVIQSFSDPTLRELWKSDGTPEGTVRVKVFSNVPDISGFLELFEDLTAVGGTLFFSGYDDWNGPHLWKSDGTEAGTVPVINPALPSRWWFEPKGLNEVGGVLYFSGRAPVATGEPYLWTTELWKSDGTPEGTVRLTDFQGPVHEWYECRLSGRVGSRAIFTLSQYPTGVHELWATDGTPQGQVRLRSFQPGRFELATWMYGSGRDTYVFGADDGIHGLEPWKTDGTPEGTVLLRDLAREHGDSQDVRGPDGSLLFLGEGTQRWGLWKWEGPAAAPVLLRDGFVQVRSGFHQSLGSVVFFQAAQSGSGAGLWRSDGTPAGTYPVQSTVFGGWGRDPGPGVVLGGMLVFSASTPWSSGRELWATDALGTGTILLKDIRPGIEGSHPSTPVKVGSALYFTADDGVHGEELWRTDGTSAGTVLVKDLVPGTASSQPRELVELNGALAFVSQGALWRLDANGGVRQLAVSHAGEVRTRMEQLTVVNGRLLFFASPGATRAPELWVYDGTSSAAAPVSLGAFDAVTQVARAGRVLYFRASDPLHGFELWRSDGTASGTWRVKDLTPGRVGGLDEMPLLGLEDRGWVFFGGSDGVHGLELWVSDGSEQGTRPVADLWPGPAPSEPRGLVRSGDSLFFRADDGTLGDELWRVGLEPALPDTTAPALVCPATLTLEALRVSGAVATLPPVRVSDALTAPVPVTYSPPSGTEFPLGTTGVTVTAKDEAGNVSTCAFDVVVRDTTAPTISCPADVAVEATGPGGAPVSFAKATASDGLMTRLTVTYSHVSGSTFPVGETVVTARARDGAGNTASCFFRVTVKAQAAEALQEG